VAVSVGLFLRASPEWLELVSLATCVGVLVCSLWVLGPIRGDALPGQESLRAATWRLLRVAAPALLASSVLGLLVRVTEMSGYPITGVLAALPTVLLHTHFGRTWILRMAAIVALSVTILARRFRRVRLLEGVMLGFALVVSAMDSASGHAADAGDFSAAELVDLLHLWAALVWGGGLLVLSWVVLPRLVEQGDLAARSIAGVATRFSRVAGIGAGVIALTAPYQAWAHGGSVEGLASSPYGQAVLAKSVLFAVLLTLGAFNRYVSVPRLQAWAGVATTSRGTAARLIAPALSLLARDARGPLSAARFARTVRLESILLVAVLLCAALLRHEVPARHARPHGHAPGAVGAEADRTPGATMPAPTWPRTLGRLLRWPSASTTWRRSRCSRT
jgi:putative copper resistance protein D